MVLVGAGKLGSDMELDAALAMGRALLDEHGLTGWTLGFDRAKTRAGVCRPNRREISLSGPLTRIHSEAEVRDTLLHEIAHALVGPGHGHDAVWRRTAIAIGGTGKRCTSADEPTVPGPWQGVCGGGHTVTRHRRPTRVRICARCTGPEADRVFTWTHHGQEVPMSPEYRAELARVRRQLGTGPEAASSPVVLVPTGTRVRVTAAGRYHGVLGVVVGRGRTRYQVRMDGGQGILNVPFALLEPEAALPFVGAEAGRPGA